VDQYSLYGFGSVDTSITPGSGLPYEDFLFKSDLEGNINWKFFLNAIPEVDLFHLINILLYKNRIYCVGTSLGSAGQLIAFDTSSNFLWSRKFYSEQQGPAYLLDLAIDSKSNIWTVGTVSDTSKPAVEGNNAWVMKLDSMGCIVPNCAPVGIYTNDGAQNFSVYPNPFYEAITVELQAFMGEVYELQVFDSFGRKVLYDSDEFWPGRLVLDLSKESSGIFFLSINFRGQVFSKILSK
jgi:hypothetical protein